MKSWDKENLVLENPIIEKDKLVSSVQAQAPVIISASRATDIPAFYSDWLVHRFDKGYIKWTNPFNGKPLYIYFKNSRLIVFWSKNHYPLIRHLDYFDSKGINYYFQFSINDYEKDGIEKSSSTET